LTKRRGRPFGRKREDEDKRPNKNLASIPEATAGSRFCCISNALGPPRLSTGVDLRMSEKTSRPIHAGSFLVSIERIDWSAGRIVNALRKRRLEGSD